MAVALEIRMCSKRKAPTGMIPVRECRRRSRNDVPWPARSGATPRLRTGAAGLAVVATMTAPYENEYDKRTFYYLGAARTKSRQGTRYATHHTMLHHASADALPIRTTTNGVTSPTMCRASPVPCEMQLRDGCTWTSVRQKVQRKFCEPRGNRTWGRIRNHLCPADGQG